MVIDVYRHSKGFLSLELEGGRRLGTCRKRQLVLGRKEIVLSRAIPWALWLWEAEEPWRGLRTLEARRQEVSFPRLSMRLGNEGSFSEGLENAETLVVFVLLGDWTE